MKYCKRCKKQEREQGEYCFKCFLHLIELGVELTLKEDIKLLKELAKS